jgi:hypothetical protein
MRSSTARQRLSPVIDSVRMLLLCCSLGLFTGTALRAAGDPPQYEWTNVTRIVAIGDVHGSYDKLISLLKGTGVVDETLVWSGGSTHLVFMEGAVDLTLLETYNQMHLLNGLEEERAVASIFSALLAVEDRHDFGRMFLPQDRRLAMADSTKAFPTSADPGSDLPEPCGPLDPELELGLRSLSRQQVAEALGSLLSPQQIDGLLARRDRILEICHVRGPKSGE